MLAWLGSLLGGPVVNGLIAAYKAKLHAANTADARAAELAHSAINAEIEARKRVVEVRKSEGAWGPTGLLMFLFGFIVWLYMAKVIVWDTMLEWGTTAPIRGTVAEWMGITIAFFFGSRTVTSIARMALTRLGR